jgi:hypothetical protein
MGLSNAERQARWRAKRDAEVERLRKEAAREQPAAKAGAATPSPELIKAREEIERLRNENAALKAQRAGAGAGKRPMPPPMPDTVEEWLAQAKAAKQTETEARKAKRAAAPETPAEDEATLLEKLEKAEKQLAANKTRIKNLSRELRATKDLYEQQGLMSTKTYHAITKCLHTDNKEPPSVKDRDEAMKLFNAWRDHGKRRTAS